MADFRFLHTADIHLDSPLHGLSRYEGVPADEVRGATRAAFDRMIQFALDERVDFVVIAGDLFDGDWRDMSTGLYFAGAMRRLAAAGVPAFVLAGNHDAASVLTRTLPWPETVRLFDHRKPQSFTLPELGVALHGWSFATQHVHEDLSAAYPPPEPGVFNIGVLHTALGGAEGHAPYAPCTAAALQAKGYDYWALGHVHDFRLEAEHPPVVFCGNLQGRNIRETGPKGAVLVEVRDRAVAELRFATLDVLRWARVIVDCEGAATVEEAYAAIRSALAAAYAREAQGRPLVVRLVLEGETPLAGALLDGAGRLRDEARALAAAVAPDLWLEKVSDHLRPPRGAEPDEAAPDDLLALLNEASRSPELIARLAEDLQPFVTTRPPAADGAEGLAAAAARGDWPALLEAAITALPARLSAARG